MQEKDQVYSRPSARIGDDGGLEVRASAAMGCRRALWLAATGYRPTNAPTDEAVTVMEAGNALEPVVLSAMQRAGWEVTPADPGSPRRVTVRLAPNLTVSGHPDATGRMPVFGGSEAIVEVKTRGPAAYKRWKAMGAELSHPDSVAQAAVYNYGTFGHARHVVISTMDTGARIWDYEIIPAERVTRALERTRAWLAPLTEHLTAHGPDPDALPERDFEAGSWRCNGCPFLAICRLGEEEGQEEVTEEREVTEEEARGAVTAYTEAQAAMKEPERAKRAALETLKAWMRRRGNGKERLGGRAVSLVRTTRFSVNHRRLNALLDPDTRAEVVSENTSEHVRVT